MIEVNEWSIAGLILLGINIGITIQLIIGAAVKDWEYRKRRKQFRQYKAER